VTNEIIDLDLRPGAGVVGSQTLFFQTVILPDVCLPLTDHV